MTNAKEAAERLRHNNYPQSTDGDCQWSADRKTIVNAYLSEHAADDDEAITEDWCMATFECHNLGLWSLAKIHCYLKQSGHVFAVEHHEGPVLMIVKTRGQLRRLIAALTDKRGE